MKKRFVVVLVEREDSENPQIVIVDAKDEDEAFSAFCKEQEMDEEFVENGEMEGEITLHYKEIV